MPPSDSPEAAARPQRQPVGGASGRGEEATADNQIELGGPAAVGTAAREAADNQIDYEQGGSVLFCSSSPAAAAAAAADARDAPALLMRQPDANPRLPILTPPAPAISAPIVVQMRCGELMRCFMHQNMPPLTLSTQTFPRALAAASRAAAAASRAQVGWLAGFAGRRAGRTPARQPRDCAALQHPCQHLSVAAAAPGPLSCFPRIVNLDLSAPVRPLLQTFLTLRSTRCAAATPCSTSAQLSAALAAALALAGASQRRRSSRDWCGVSLGGPQLLRGCTHRRGCNKCHHHGVDCF